MVAASLGWMIGDRLEWLDQHVMVAMMHLTTGDSTQDARLPYRATVRAFELLTARI